jgi:hypothetical protein
MMLAAEVGGACVRAEERAFSLSLSLLEPLTRRVLVQSIPHCSIITIAVLFFDHTPAVSLSTILISYTNPLRPYRLAPLCDLPTPGPWAL